MTELTPKKIFETDKFKLVRAECNVDANGNKQVDAMFFQKTSTGLTAIFRVRINESDGISTPSCVSKDLRESLTPMMYRLLTLVKIKTERAVFQSQGMNMGVPCMATHGLVFLSNDLNVLTGMDDPQNELRNAW